MIAFVELKEKLDRVTNEVLMKDPPYITRGDACLVKMVPEKPLCVETFEEYPPLGRFAMRDMRQTIGVGIIKSVTRAKPKEEEKKAPVASYDMW